jgi:DNA-binding MarR family transcriptional regulator
VGLEAFENLVLAHARLLDGLDEDLRREHGWSLGDYDVLFNLARVPRLRMCDLAGAVLLSPSGVSRRVERLERAGLVLRERASGDARNIEARLTPEGRRLFRRLRRTHLAGIKARFVDHFDARELETLRNVLEKLPHRRDGGP